MGAEAQKFLFEARFDAQAARESAEQRAARERTAAKESEAVHAAAFEEGRQAGRAEAERDLAHATEKTLASVADGLKRLHAQRHEMQAELTANAVNVAVTLVGKLLPALMRRHALAEIEALIETTLRQLLNEPRVVVRLHDSRLDALKAHIDDIARRCGFDGDVVLLADPELAPEDCRIEWADGGAERNVDRLWHEIERAFARFLPPAPHDAKPATSEGGTAGAAGAPNKADQRR